MNTNFLRGGARYFVLSALAIITTMASLNASAIPVFARQTGFKCVACHVGGEYPQLTSLGRYFKLTGYTMGNANDLFNLTTNIDRPPLSVWLQTGKQWYTTSNKNVNTSGISPTSEFSGGSAFTLQTLSLFSGGHITDNIGAFVQWTATNDTSGVNNNSGTWTVGIDNTEIRYADHFVTPSHDWIVGTYANNRVTMSDVWNTQENWTSDWIGYFNGFGGGFTQVPGLAPTTYLQSSASQHNMVGLGAYSYLDRTWYAEIAAYKGVSHGPLSFMTGGNTANTEPLMELSPYVRLAYNKEWGPHSLTMGLHGMIGYGHNANPAGSITYDWTAPINTYRDIGLDAQYQYVLDPHYFAAHFRLTRENASYASAQATNPNNNLSEIWGDLTYIYQAKYGAMLFYHGATGSTDATLYGSLGAGGSNTGSPDWSSWTPSLFYAPWQNVRIGYMYTFYTKLGGATSNGGITDVAGANLGPHDFNTSMLYATIIY